MIDPSFVTELLANAAINPLSFEAELGLLIHKWITISGIDNVIEGIDIAVGALEQRRDLEIAATGPIPSRT